MKEGGFVVKLRKGTGLAAVLGVSSNLPLEFRSVTLGAQIGGGAEWGFGLILGLRTPRCFGGEYQGDTRGAAVGDKSVSITKLVKRSIDATDLSYHELYLIGSTLGLSAGAAFGNLTITVKD